MFKKSRRGRQLTKARKRAQKTTSPQLQQWADQTLTEIARGLRKNDLDEAHLWSSVLLDLVEELQEREQLTR